MSATPPVKKHKSLINELRSACLYETGTIPTSMARLVFQLQRPNGAVNLQNILEQIGIQLKVAELSEKVIMDNRGSLGEEVIWVNQKLAPRERRFAVAHALGHGLIHSYKENYHCNCDVRMDVAHSVESLVKEKDANIFACALLCPWWHLETIAGNTSDIANTLLVPHTVIQYVLSKGYDSVNCPSRII